MNKQDFNFYRADYSNRKEKAFDIKTLKIAPSPFFNSSKDNIIKKAIDKYNSEGELVSIDVKEILDNYRFVQCKKGYSFPLRGLSHKALLLAISISDNLEQDSNLYYLNVDYQCTFCNVKPTTLDDLIKELVSKEILSRTTINRLYIVNHDVFFNGNKAQFIKDYIGIYNDNPVLRDKKGRVILTASSIEKKIKEEGQKKE